MADIIPLKFLKTTGGAVVAPSELNPGDTIPSAYIGGLIGSNMLINCGVPVINQRGFAGGALAAGVYGYDRWKAGTGGCNVTINATTGVFTHTSGPLVQVVESPEAAWGVPVTLSVESPSGTISVNIGGATGSITAGTGRRSVTLTPTGSGDMTVQLTATAVTYSQPKLERGSVSTIPEYRHQAVELLLCQRYYRKSFPYSVAPAQNSGVYNGAIAYVANQAGAAVSGVPVTFGTTMRANPVLTFYNPAAANANWINRNLMLDGSAGQTSYGIINTDGFVAVNNTQHPSTAVGNSYFIHYSANAEL